MHLWWLLFFLVAAVRSADPSQCPVNHYLTGNICVACGDAMKWCVSCTGMGQCTACAGGAYLDNGYCKPCDSGCERCTVAGSCTACSKAHCRMSGGTCKDPGSAYTGCSQCAHDTSRCTGCADGYFYKGPSDTPCVACPINCKACKSATECSEPNPGYYLNSNKQPTQCSDGNCAICPTGTCTECKPGYTLSGSTSGTCIQCGTTNCKICSIADKCTFCNDGYALNTAEGCRPCTRNCERCANSTVSSPGLCLEDGCRAGYNYSTIYRACLPCPENCAECYHDAYRRVSVCTRCNQDSVPATGPNIYGLWCGTPPTKQCSKSSFLENGLCLSCSIQVALCYKCTERYTCTECFSGAFLVDNLCVACSSNCTECAGAHDKCIDCDENYILVNGTCLPTELVIPNCKKPQERNGNTLICKECHLGYYLTPEKDCVKCVENCAECVGTREEDCFIGYNGYRFNEISKKMEKCQVNDCELCPDEANVCTTCKPEYYYDESASKCLEGSVPFCRVYGSSATECSECIPGFGLGKTSSVCAACLPGCMGECTPTTCDSGLCLQGFYYRDESCMPCPLECSACHAKPDGQLLCTRCSSGTILALTPVVGLTCGRIDTGHSKVLDTGLISGIVVLVLVLVGVAIVIPFALKWARQRGARAGRLNMSRHGSEDHDTLLMEKQPDLI